MNRSPGSCPGDRKLQPPHEAKADAAGKGGLGDAVALTGGPARVITLADEHAADFGVTLSAPTTGRSIGYPQATAGLAEP